MKKEKNIYKIIFWVLTVCSALLIIGFIALTPIATDMSQDDQMALGIIGITMLVFTVILVFIGLLVYKDAKKIGMNPWLWVLVVIYVPNGLGIVVYLIVRHSEKRKPRCSNCQYPIEAHFVVCPKCGNDLKNACPSCGRPVEVDWTVCPHCKASL